MIEAGEREPLPFSPKSDFGVLISLSVVTSKFKL